MKWCLLVFVFVIAIRDTSAQAPKSQQVAFRIAVLEHTGNISSAWLAPANVKGVRVRENENNGAATSKIAEGELKLSRSNFSTSWLHANVINGNLAFYESAPIPETEPPPLVALAKFPATKIPKQIYLLLVPSPGKENPYRVIAIDAATSDFPAGSHLVVNLGKDTVRGTFGEQQFMVEPDQRAFVSGIKNTNPRGYFQVYVAHGKEPDWKRIAYTQWKLDPTAQRICLVYRSGPRVAIRTFNQFVRSVDAPEMPEDTREPIGGPEGEKEE